jgi:Mn-dependent DtxR family transcriptional regulator
MTFFEELPPIEDRALDGNGREMFTEMIAMQLRLMSPSPAKIARKLKWNGSKGAEVAYQLENAGLVNLTYNGPHNVHAMHLTHKGREVARDMGLDL